MKQLYFLITLLLSLTVSDNIAQHHGGMTNSGKEKSPAIAALLSIQPLPIAFGNFYTNDWERGIIYTTVELVLFIPATVLLGRNNWGWGMHDYSSGDYEDNKSWTNTERNQFYYLLAGYVIVKIVSAFDAGYSAENINRNLLLKYDEQTNSALLTYHIPIL